MFNVKKHKVFSAGSLFSMIALCAIYGIAQQPLSDGKGESTLLLDRGGFVQFNAADPSFRLGFIRDISDDKWTFGANLSGKLSGTEKSILGNNGLSPDVKFGFSIGRKCLWCKEFNPQEVRMTTVFVMGMERILKKNGTISKTTDLPSPGQLKTLLNNEVPGLKERGRKEREELISEAIKKESDKPIVKSALEELQNKCNNKGLEACLADINTTSKSNSADNETQGVLTTVAAILQPFSERITCFSGKSPKGIDCFELYGLDGGKPTLKDYLAAVSSYCRVKEDADQNRPSSFCELKDRDIGIIFTLPELKKYRDYDRLVFQGSYGYNQFSLFNPALSFNDQLSKRNFHSPSAQLIYNRHIQGNKILGISLGIDRSNNSGDLKMVDLRDFMTAVNGGTTREFGTTKKALLGNFTESTRTFANGDFAWFPGAWKSRVGINFFSRAGLSGEEKGFRQGIGLFFSQKGAPTKVIGGISASVDHNGKFNVAIISGFNF